jgi:hypothetical protein
MKHWNTYSECDSDIPSYGATVRITCGYVCRNKRIARLRNERSYGRRKVDRYGRVLIRRPEHPRANVNGLVFEHVLIAEKALGKPLPEKVIVHHFDRCPSNNANSNLVICQNQSYHMLLHARQRIKDAGGDPNTDAICGHCQKLRPRTGFFKLVSSCLGLSTSKCRECYSIHNRGDRSAEVERAKQRRLAA